MIITDSEFSLEDYKDKKKRKKKSASIESDDNFNIILTRKLHQIDKNICQNNMKTMALKH